MKNHSDILFLLATHTAILSLFIGASNRWAHLFLYNKPQPENLKLLSFFHAVIIVMMLFPVFVINQLPLFLLAFPDRIDFSQAIAFLGCFGTIGFFPWKKFSDKVFEEGSVAVVEAALYGSSRIVFLVAYEWFFRGMLLASFSSWLGIYWAIAVNIALYGILHIHKSKQEIIGCILLGLVLCLFTTWWHSIWPAIILHLQIAFVNEWPRLKQFAFTQKQPAL
jgi:membrane protease YdiL (CAAX protease family)